MKLHYSSTITVLRIHKRVQPSEGYPAITLTATKTVAIRICFYQQSHFHLSFLSVFMDSSTSVPNPGPFSPVGSDHSRDLAQVQLMSPDMFGFSVRLLLLFLLLLIREILCGMN